MSNTNPIQMLNELVRQEVHTHLAEITKLLEADLSAAFNTINDRMNDLLSRIEKLEGTSRPPEESKEL